MRRVSKGLSFICTVATSTFLSRVKIANLCQNKNLTYLIHHHYQPLIYYRLLTVYSLYFQNYDLKFKLALLCNSLKVNRSSHLQGCSYKVLFRHISLHYVSYIVLEKISLSEEGGSQLNHLQNNHFTLKLFLFRCLVLPTPCRYLFILPHQHPWSWHC